MGFTINRVYTRKGDDGQTSLVDGRLVSKAHPRVATYGELDELNSVLGCVKEELGERTAELRPVLEDLQSELFDLGAQFATSPHDYPQAMWKVSEKDVERLEKLCDHFGKGLPELTSFILPGGSALAAKLHVARTVARRLERTVVEFRDTSRGRGEPDAVPPEALQYINRLSDLLFIFARWALEREGREAPIWSPANKRSANA